MAKQVAALRYSELWKSATELQQNDEETKFKPLQPIGLSNSFATGVKRGAILEVHGRGSSGRTAISQHILGTATAAGEICAVVDLADNFDPASAQAAGVELSRMVWVRCGRNAEHAMRACDLLLHAGGFGVVVLDLCEANARVLNKIPVSYWYRFRKAVERTPAILVVSSEQPQARSCTSDSFRTERRRVCWVKSGPFAMLDGIDMEAVGAKRSFAGGSLSFLKFKAARQGQAV